ncbi:tetratricopeptide repeat protein [Amycolatopsis carbonis]|uniref:Tetratricopeptide repeat protein n=1 Tax=Amycolatopsis carbonis TaxID=715471 RepID=A0A9Y2INY9_9PSEU|nr:tetratricopeptide repeat protein [Amycolatopsis sp. 2-15]WIX83312.1 tetratricopeptide repeat protein [Amycolatopsis sp. 2-15]
MAETNLQAVRKHLGYKADEVIRMLLRRADTLAVPVMSATSLKTKLSRWENGREAVSQPYRRLFRDIYGRTSEELGFPEEEANDEADELISRLALARSVDSEIVEVFKRQVDQARHVDRRLGGLSQLDQLRSNIDQLQGLLGFSTMNGQRQALAGVLTEASALAGWEALDRNAIRQAWEHHETAKAAAREAGSPILLAHSTAQQAFILIDLGEVQAAVGQLAEARALADRSAPPVLRAWMAAAHGEGLSAAGQRDDALRAFDAASAHLPTDPVDPALPFLFLGGAHLDRWRGNALSKLGEPDAIQQLTTALPLVPPDFVRARTGMLVDLAFAYAAAGDRDATLAHARQARRLAAQIKSDRQLHRLSGLILPGSTSSVA